MPKDRVGILFINLSEIVRLAVIDLAKAVLSAAVDGKQWPLSQNPTFQSTNPLPESNTGISYIAVESLIEQIIKPFLTRTERANFQRDVEPLLKPVKGIGYATGVPKENSQSSVLFLYVSE